MNIVKNIHEGWVETTLGEIVKIGRGSSPRPIQDYMNNKQGIPWVKIADATASNNKFIQNTKEFIIEKGRSTTVYPGDLIVSNSATPGIPKFMKIEACVHDGWLVFSNYKDLQKDFLYYFFLDYRKKLVHSASGTVFKNLTTDIVRNVPIILPPISEQKAIAEVLISFDEKIEFLQTQNNTLDEISQTIFKEWFGKYKIGDELPKGWSFQSFYSIGDFLNGSAFKNSDFSSEKEGLPIIKIAELKNGITENTAYTTKMVDSKYLIKNYDILFSWSGSPETSIDIFIWTKNKAILNQHTFNVKIKDPSMKSWYYFLLKYNKPLFIQLAKMKQTTGLGHVTIANLKEYKFVYPSSYFLNGKKSLFDAYFEKIAFNYIQIQSLTKTRDALLPKLMSGQVRVKM